MNKNNIILTATALALAIGVLSADAKSFKRGVSENAFNLKEEIDVIKTGTSWFYTWGNVPNNNIKDLPDADFEFVPMCWNANYNADNIRSYCKSHPETKYLLGFNEPNFKNQANMTPEAAAAAWPAVQALAKELGLKLVGPAVNYSPDGPENDPYTWYAKFVNLVGKDAFDYIAIHNYSGGVDGMRTMIDKFYGLYGKQIWLTEFCNWPGNNTVTPEAQITSMVAQVEYLEKCEKVYRYAWFKAKGSITTSPAYGLIVPKNGAGERELSEQGKVYVNMSDFDQTRYHSMTEVVPAIEYVNSNTLVLGSSFDGKNPSPIEITKFNSGAYADYQFDVPAAGSYTLTLRVSGMGEPTRFDPTVGIYSVDNNGKELSTLADNRQFQLPNDNQSYVDVQFAVSLAAGKQRIRIKDGGPYSPSGIHISCLTFNPNGSVSDMTIDTEKVACHFAGECLQFTGNAAIGTASVYDLNGRLVASGEVEGNALAAEGLADGVYVVKAVTAEGAATTLKVVK